MNDLAQNLILDSFISKIVNKSNFDHENVIFSYFDDNFFDNFAFDWLTKL